MRRGRARRRGDADGDVPGVTVLLGSDEPLSGAIAVMPTRLTSLALAASLVVARVSEAADGDWLVDGAPYVANVTVSASKQRVDLANGLLHRSITLSPNAATVAFDNLMTGQSELRSVRPEATITIDGVAYPIGGLEGQPLHNYLRPEWVDRMTPIAGSFRAVGHRVGRTAERFPWRPRAAWLSRPAPWPAPGVSLAIDFRAPEGGPRGALVTVHYELYDAMPLLAKWISVTNEGTAPLTLDAFRSEILAWVEPASMVGGSREDFAAAPRSIHVESEYSFGGSMDSASSAPGVHWVDDPLYGTQVHYDRHTPCLLECGPTVGPGATIAPGDRFESPRVFELLFDSTDRERRGLAQRRMYRAIAPWSQENPLIFHAGSAEPEAVRNAIDQAAEVGFEMVIMTFGSGFDIERRDAATIARWKELADYAHAKGIALGGYSLLASRSIDDANDVVNPATGHRGGFAVFGNSPCIGSPWGEQYFATLTTAFEATGLDVLEHDGSYPGDVCASTSHPGHRGLADSQWTQWRTITNFYRWCRSRGIYLNVPDWYYLSGASKCAMGYRETNWSLPRAEQEIIERQNIFDGTWSKTPSMGWMFVPLMQYHGGGAEATIEPLDAHRDHYRQRLDNLLSAGVQACYRGPRLFDTPATRDLVRERVAWFRSHRRILESDIVHGRRPDGRDIDWFVHVDPDATSGPNAERAMLVVHNPTAAPIERDLPISLWYAGLRDSSRVTGSDGRESPCAIDATGRAVVHIRVPAHGMAWYSFRKAT